MSDGPHQNQPVKQTGVPLAEAKAVMIMIHGRGATAESILTLADEFEAPDYAFLAPQAANNTWYPHSFLSPIPLNEPGITSGLTAIDSLITGAIDAGISQEKVLLLGFSQGACLASEYVARHARRYGGLVALSGGLIGPNDTPRDYDGALARTPVFLGCSDVDFHIPKERVVESAAVFERLEAKVTLRLYRGMGHTVNQDEIDAVQQMITMLLVD